MRLTTVAGVVLRFRVVLKDAEQGGIGVDHFAYHVARDIVEVVLIVFLLCLPRVETRVYRSGEIRGDNAINQMVQRSAVDLGVFRGLFTHTGFLFVQIGCRVRAP